MQLDAFARSFARPNSNGAAALILSCLALSVCNLALAQDESAARNGAEAAAPQETPDEVVVTGKRLSELRVEVQNARKRAYDIFNQINSDNDFDVHCGDQTRIFSHAKVFVCRPQFEKRIEAQAAREYLDGLLVSCRGEGGVTQECMFSAAGQRGLARAAGAESPLGGKRQQLNEEIVRLANQDPRFAQAILDFYAASQSYKAARGKRRQDDD
jgi:hypothetical protein